MIIRLLLVISSLILSLFTPWTIANSKSEDPIIIKKDSLYWDVLYDKEWILWYNYIWFRSDYNLTKTKLSARNCYYSSEFVAEKNMVFIFKIDFLEECDNPEVALFYKTEKVPWSDLVLDMYSDFDFYNYYTDFPSNKLKKYRDELLKKKKTLSKYPTWSPLETSIKLRQLKEIDFKSDFIQNILNERVKKYIVPVYWESLPEKGTYLPNAWRPYRDHYTDWVHHWWDVYSDYWTDVIALDKWIIIRTVSWFKFDDLKKLDFNSHDSITYLENLDKLRWNQVWLKTMKWDVVFYSHLSQLSPDAKVWSIVHRWQVLGKVWISWVPDRNYKDIHLHFELQKNPYNDPSKFGNYSYLDIMKWNWYYKWESFNTIVERQKEIFNY